MAYRYTTHHASFSAARVGRQLRICRAALPNSSDGDSQRKQQLLEVDLPEGWGVEVAPAPTSRDEDVIPTVVLRSVEGTVAAQLPGIMSMKGPRRSKLTARAFVDKQSPEAMLNLTILNSRLEMEAELQSGGLTANTNGKRKRKGRGTQALVVSDRLANFTRSRPRVALDADTLQPLANDEDEDDDDSNKPFAQIRLGEDGSDEVVTYDDEGNEEELSALEEEDLEHALPVVKGKAVEFDTFGWEQFAAGEGEEEGEEGAAVTEQVDPEYEEELMRGVNLRKRAGAARVHLLRSDPLDADESAPPRSVLADMREEQRRREDDTQLVWGGSGAATGIDYDEQQEMLERFFPPSDVKRLLEQQRQAEQGYGELKRARTGKMQQESKLHEQLRIIHGSVAGRKLVSSRGENTRPMMEKVRAALFNMVTSQAGFASMLPPTARWLDLFAGTGAVGLEALSRGAAECHFVELDPWVGRNVLGRNIDTCGFRRQSVIHTQRVEDFLLKAASMPRFAGGPFDFVSCCPPYLLVSYPDLLAALAASSLLHPGSVVFVEYAKQLKGQISETLGPLQRVRDRKYGRTWVAVYAGVA